jgi:hypothetical protein
MEGIIISLMVIGVSAVGYLAVDQLNRFSEENRKDTFTGAPRKRSPGSSGRSK